MSFKIFDIASMGMSAQSVRLNSIASNLANAETVSGTPETAYRSLHPVFSTVGLTQDLSDDFHGKGVKVDKVIQSNKDIERRYEPGHPLADQNGFVYSANVNVMQEMADMISASRTYQHNVQMMNASKEIMLQTLNIGQ